MNAPGESCYNKATLIYIQRNCSRLRFLLRRNPRRGSVDEPSCVNNRRFAMAITRVRRPTLQELEVSPGKRTRLHRLLYTFGPANGTLLFLPIDQGLEHGPRDFFANPASKDPEFQLRIAKEGGFSGIVFHIGLAEKYMQHYAGEVPLVLKLNGKTEIPSDHAPISPMTATVEDAVRLGA